MADPIVPMQPVATGPLSLPQSVPNPAIPDAPPSLIGMNGGTQADDLQSIQNATAQAPPSLAQQPKQGRLKSLLLNMAQGASLALGYESGIPQAQALQAQTATEKATLPYAGPLAAARTQQAQGDAQMQQAMMKPVTVSMPDGTQRTMPGWLAKIMAPQTIKYQNNQDNINSKESIANNKLDAQLLSLGYKRDGEGNLSSIPKDQLSPILQTKANGPQNEAQWIAKAVAGDPVAKQKLDMLNQSRTALAYARGAGLAKGRADNSPFATFDNDGNLTTIPASEAIKYGYPSAQVWNAVFGPTGSTKSQAQASGAVAEHIPDFENSVRALAAKGQLGPVMGRLNTYLTQGYGGDDKDVAEFITTIGLLKSGAVRAHFGAKGGQQILAKFDTLLNTSQEPNALIGSAEGIKKFLDTYKATGTPNPKAAGTGGNLPGAPNTASGKTINYKIVNGQLVAQ